MSERYDFDVAVVGGGPGGYVAGIRAAQLGARACVIERAHLGGVCTNVGCIPTKTLWHAAHLARQAQGADAFGVNVGTVKVDFLALAARRDAVIDKLRGGIEGLLKANGVELMRASASFLDAHTLRLEGEDGARDVSAGKVIIATGSRPVELGVAPFDHELIIDSSDAVAADELPQSIIVVGGGYIGVELAGAYAAFGVEVTVVEALETLLPGLDGDCAALVTRTLKKQGVKVHTSAPLGAAEKADGSVQAVLAGGTRVTAQKMLVCVGRQPDCADLAVGNAGLEPDDDGGLPVNEHMQTARPHIYAVGDACGGPMLAHVASRQAVVAAQHATGTITAAMDYAVVPACVFGFPEVAWVGMSPERAAEDGREVVVKKFPLLALGKAHTVGATEGFVKMTADAGTGQLLGVHICCEGASALLGEAALALQLECTAEELARTIHAHPTMPESLMEAADGIVGLPINWRG